MTELIRYDAMCRAIADCYAVDEVKDIRDKAMAFEQYARQARNTEAERRACEIRLRAERKAGKLLQEMEKAQGRRTDLVAACDQVADSATPKNRSSCTVDFDEPKTLNELGISKTQSSRWQRLATVPEDKFEEALADPRERPTTAGILHRCEDEPATMRRLAVDPQALWIWGRLRDIEREQLIKREPGDLLTTMTGLMRADIARLLPSTIAWLETLEESTDAQAE